MSQLISALLLGSTFLLAFIVFSNPRKLNKKANSWFGAFVACFFMVVLQNTGASMGLLREDSLWFEFLGIASFAIAPVFFLSVSYYVEPVRNWRFKDYFHFGFAFLILLIIVLSLFVNQEPVATVSDKQLNSAELVLNTLFGLQLALYCLLAYRKIAQHRNNIRQLNSSTERIELKWLQQICIGIIILAVFWLADILFRLSEAAPWLDYLTSLLYISGIFYIAYHWLWQKEVFPYPSAEKEEVNRIIAQATKQDLDKKKPISDEKLSELKMQVQELIEVRKLFMTSDLNLVGLAHHLNISSHLLSYVINKGFNENFYQLINRYRIEEAKKLMVDPKMDHLSLLGIAFEVGFSSKTVFNTTFKKITSQTPSAYKKSMQPK